MKEKVIHIRALGRKGPRLCGAKGNFEPSGKEDDLPICSKCLAIQEMES